MSRREMLVRREGGGREGGNGLEVTELRGEGVDGGAGLGCD